MVQKTRLASLLGLGSALLLSGVAHAQTATGTPPGMAAPGYSSSPGYPGSSSGSTSSAPTGAVNNQQAVDSSTTITSSSSDLSSTDVSATDDGTLQNTGGEPWMMALGGIAIAAGALTVRRRIN